MTLYPLRFEPIFRRYIWGGRKLGTVLGKLIGSESDYAESWEIVDRGVDQSHVLAGPLAGTTLARLMLEHGPDLLGQHHPQSRFPLLFKFLDCEKTLSVQVHPDDEAAAQLDPPDFGKTEAWVVLETAPGSVIYAGLKRGFDRAALARELNRGTCELCLHRVEPHVGDCIFLPAGTVHALGAGLLIAEIQQSSDATFRLHDWNRVDAQGKPRPLHVEQSLNAIDYDRGPINPSVALPTSDPRVERLVECESFVLDRWHLREPATIGGDDRFHLLTVLEGQITVAGDLVAAPIERGGTILLPASVGTCVIEPVTSARLLDMYLPNSCDRTGAKGN